MGDDEFSETSKGYGQNEVDVVIVYNEVLDG